MPRPHKTQQSASVRMINALTSNYNYDPERHLTTIDAAKVYGMTPNTFLKNLSTKNVTPKQPHQYGTRGVGYFFDKVEVVGLKKYTFWKHMLSTVHARKHQHFKHSDAMRRAAQTRHLKRTSGHTEEVGKKGLVAERVKLYRTLTADGVSPDEAAQMIKLGVFD